MAHNKRWGCVFNLLFILYLIMIFSITLVPVDGVDFAVDDNYQFFNSIGRYIDGIKSEGVFAEENFMTIFNDGFIGIVNIFTYPFKNLMGNILLFIPFGLLYPLCRKKVLWIEVVLAILVFTLSIELLQFIFFTSRSADVDDMLLNFVGGILGYFLYQWLE